MHERIKELANRAGIKLPDDTDFNGHIYRNRLEIFAQLIVRECADIASINGHQYEPPGKYILDHFGLKQQNKA